MRYLTPVLFAAAASVLSTAPAYADLGDQLFKLLPDDGAEGDFFGPASVRGNSVASSMSALYHCQTEKFSSSQRTLLGS